MRELLRTLRTHARLAARRARTDLSLLGAITGFVALASLLAVVGPGLLLSTIDGGARDEVRAAGRGADVELRMIVGDRGAGRPASVTPQDVALFAEGLPETLTPALAAVERTATLTVVAPYASIRLPDGSAARDGYDLQVRTAQLGPGDADALRLVDGRLPADGEGEETTTVEIALGAAAAEKAGIAVGDRLGARFQPLDRLTRGGDRPSLDYLVVGIVEPVDAADERWYDRGGLWEPVRRRSTSAASDALRLTALAAPAGMLTQAGDLQQGLDGLVRVTIDLPSITAERADALGAELRALVVDASPLAVGTSAVIDLRTGLVDVLGAYPLVARAALAQMSVMMAGVVGIAAVVQLLLAGLLIDRRFGALALERARGATLAGVGLRTLLESAVVALIGTAVGLAASQLVFPGRIAEPLAAVAVGVVAALAAPVTAVLRVRPLWAGRRTPANRDARRRLVRRAAGRRLVVELLVLVLAAGALWVLRSRGLLQSRTGGIDPLLAAAPLLVCLAIALIVLRLFPWPVRLIGAVGRRDTGVLGLLAAVRARQGLALAPLLALTLGAALATSGGLLVDTVRGGLDEAAWERVGADARIDAPVTEAAIDRVRSAPGVEAASATATRRAVGIDLDTTSRSATVIAVDDQYGALVDTLPGGDGSGFAALRATDDLAPDAPLPALVDASIARALLSDDIAMYYGADYVPLHVVGVVDQLPEGYAEAPYVFVDLAGLSARTDAGVPAGRLLVGGRGAAAAVSDLGFSDDAVTTRQEWMDERRSLAIVAGVDATMVVATASAVLLAALALVATVVGGSRERGRTLAMLRTLGMRPRLGWWLALAELLPVTIAAVLGGAVAGLAVVLALTPALGLDVLAGGLATPDPAVSPLVFAGIGGGAIVLLAVGVLADVLVHRRDRLNEVLRVGETV